MHESILCLNNLNILQNVLYSEWKPCKKRANIKSAAIITTTT